MPLIWEIPWHRWYCKSKAKPTQQQPTAFTLDTYTLSEVFETPELITSLASYSEGRTINSAGQKSPAAREPRSASVLFLQVTAAADYFTTNKTLMHEVPPVHADLSE